MKKKMWMRLLILVYHFSIGSNFLTTVPTSLAQDEILSVQRDVQEVVLTTAEQLKVEEYIPNTEENTLSVDLPIWQSEEITSINNIPTETVAITNSAPILEAIQIDPSEKIVDSSILPDRSEEITQSPTLENNSTPILQLPERSDIGSEVVTTQISPRDDIIHQDPILSPTIEWSPSSDPTNTNIEKEILNSEPVVTYEPNPTIDETISPTEYIPKIFNIVNKYAFWKEIQDKNIKVDLPKNLKVSSYKNKNTYAPGLQKKQEKTSEELSNMLSLDSQDIWWADQVISSQDSEKTFHFGIEGEDIVFSEPVKIQVELWTTQYDGQTIQVLAKHGNDTTFGTLGLATDPTTSCDIDGNTTIPSNSITVQDGKVTFYVCRASTYTFSFGGTNVTLTKSGVLSWDKVEYTITINPIIWNALDVRDFINNMTVEDKVNILQGSYSKSCNGTPIRPNPNLQRDTQLSPPSHTVGFYDQIINCSGGVWTITYTMEALSGWNRNIDNEIWISNSGGTLHPNNASKTNWWKGILYFISHPESNGLYFWTWINENASWVNLTINKVAAFTWITTEELTIWSGTDLHIGDWYKYFITVWNNGPWDAWKVQMQDKLPKWVKYVKHYPRAITWTDQLTVTTDPSGVDTVTWFLTWALKKDETRTIEMHVKIIDTITGTLDSSNNFTNTATGRLQSWFYNITQPPWTIITWESDTLNIDLSCHPRTYRGYIDMSWHIYNITWPSLTELLPSKPTYIVNPTQSAIAVNTNRCYVEDNVWASTLFTGRAAFMLYGIFSGGNGSYQYDGTNYTGVGFYVLDQFNTGYALVHLTWWYGSNLQNIVKSMIESYDKEDTTSTDPVESNVVHFQNFSITTWFDFFTDAIGPNTFTYTMPFAVGRQWIECRYTSPLCSDAKLFRSVENLWYIWNWTPSYTDGIPNIDQAGYTSYSNAISTYNNNFDEFTYTVTHSGEYATWSMNYPPNLNLWRPSTRNDAYKATACITCNDDPNNPWWTSYTCDDLNELYHLGYTRDINNSQWILGGSGIPVGETEYYKQNCGFTCNNGATACMPTYDQVGISPYGSLANCESAPICLASQNQDIQIDKSVIRLSSTWSVWQYTLNVSGSLVTGDKVTIIDHLSGDALYTGNIIVNGYADPYTTWYDNNGRNNPKTLTVELLSGYSGQNIFIIYNVITDTTWYIYNTGIVYGSGGIPLDEDDEVITWCVDTDQDTFCDIVDLWVSKTASTWSYCSGYMVSQPITWTINYGNTWNIPVMVDVTDILPNWISYSFSNPSYSSNNGQQYIWSNISLAPGQTGQIIINTNIIPGTIWDLTNNVNISWWWITKTNSYLINAEDCEEWVITWALYINKTNDPNMTQWTGIWSTWYYILTITWDLNTADPVYILDTISWAIYVTWSVQVSGYDHNPHWTGIITNNDPDSSLQLILQSGRNSGDIVEISYQVIYTHTGNINNIACISGSSVGINIDNVINANQWTTWGTPTRPTNTLHNGTVVWSFSQYPINIYTSYAASSQRGICDEFDTPIIDPPAIPICWNNIVEAGEQCDDGNTNNTDGCSGQCERETPNCADFWFTVTSTWYTWDTITWSWDNNVSWFIVRWLDRGNYTPVWSFTSPMTHIYNTSWTYTVTLTIANSGNQSLTWSCTDTVIISDRSAWVCDSSIDDHTYYSWSVPNISNWWNIWCSIGTVTGLNILPSNMSWICQSSNGGPDSATCSLSIQYCGDGEQNWSEQCDDGNGVNTDACSNTCQLVAPSCSSFDFNISPTTSTVPTSVTGSWTVPNGFVASILSWGSGITPIVSPLSPSTYTYLTAWNYTGTLTIANSLSGSMTTTCDVSLSYTLDGVCGKIDGKIVQSLLDTNRFLCSKGTVTWFTEIINSIDGSITWSRYCQWINGWSTSSQCSASKPGMGIDYMDLSINKYITWSSWPYGSWDRVTYEIDIYNSGGTTLPNNVSLYDLLPAWFELDSWSISYKYTGDMADSNEISYNGLTDSGHLFEINYFEMNTHIIITYDVLITWAAVGQTGINVASIIPPDGADETIPYSWGTCDPDNHNPISWAWDFAVAGTNNVDCAQVYVELPPNTPLLSINKTWSLDTYKSGDTIWYTITLSNIGNTWATDIEVTESYPTGFVYGTSSVTTGNYDSGSKKWSIPYLASWTSAYLYLTGVLASTGTAVNTAIVTSGNCDTCTGDWPTNDEDSYDLSIVKDIIEPSIVLSGSDINYTLTYYNDSSSGRYVAIKDTYDDHHIYISWYISGTNIWPSIDITNNTLLWTGIWLDAMTTGIINITFQVIGQSGDVFINTWYVGTLSWDDEITWEDETNQDNNTDDATWVITYIPTPVNYSPELVITKSGSIISYHPGDDIIYWVTISNIWNTGTDLAIVKEIYPTWFVQSGDITWTTNNNSTGTVVGQNSSWFEFHIDHIYPNQYFTITLSGKLYGTDTWINQAIITSWYCTTCTDIWVTPPYPPVPPIPEFELDKTVDRQWVYSGDVVTWTLNYRNKSDIICTDMKIIDLLPDNFIYWWATRNNTPITGIIWYSPRSYTYSIGTLPIWWSGNIIITGTVWGSPGTHIQNTGVLYSDGNCSGIYNTGTTGVNILSGRNIWTTKSVDKPVVALWQDVIWTIVYSNNSQLTAYNVTLEDTLPAGVQYKSASKTPNIPIWNNKLSRDIGTLSPWQTWSIIITTTTLSIWTHVNYVKISSPDELYTWDNYDDSSIIVDNIPTCQTCGGIYTPTPLPTPPTPPKINPPIIPDKPKKRILNLRDYIYHVVEETPIKIIPKTGVDR